MHATTTGKFANESRDTQIACEKSDRLFSFFLFILIFDTDELITCQLSFAKAHGIGTDKSFF